MVSLKNFVIFALSCAAVMIAISLYLKIKGAIEIKKEKRKEQKNEKINKETFEKIDAVTSGDFDADFDAGVDILHDLAERR